MRFNKGIFYGITAMFMLFMLAVSVTTVQAQDPLREKLSWTAPQEYTDGTTIEAGDLTGYTVYCGQQSGEHTLTLSVPGDTTEVQRNELMDSMGLLLGDEYFCAVSASAANNTTSAKSNEAHFVVVDERVPNAPVLSTQ